MSDMHREPPPCDGCLGTRRCWVCLGTGVVDRRQGGIDACASCYGSGKCKHCQPVSVVDLGSPYGLPTTDVADEEPEASSETAG
jgi:hypothetical protein